MLHVTVHIPPVVLTGTQSSVYSTLQFIFHQLFWLVRRVRCIVRYSSYSTSCSDWYAEFGVQYCTVHSPPVVLTGTQSSLYCTLQFIFHKFSWLWYAALVVVPVICYIVLIDSLIKLNASREITNYAYYKVKQLYVICHILPRSNDYCQLLTSDDYPMKTLTKNLIWNNFANLNLNYVSVTIIWT